MTQYFIIKTHKTRNQWWHYKGYANICIREQEELSMERNIERYINFTLLRSSRNYNTL